MLDDMAIYKTTDPGGMLELLRAFPKQIEDGRRLAQEADLKPLAGRKFDNIVLCGMGGSAIGGDLVKSYTIDSLRLPFVICRDYDLPGFVNDGSLVIGASYSGNTEETLSAFAQALERGASAAVLSTGGKIIEIAREKGLVHIVLPSGLPPRAALGYSFSPLLTFFERLEFVADQTAFIKETVSLLEDGVDQYSPEAPWEKNVAKATATILHGSLPIIFSDDTHFNAVAVRFRGQINENAKQLAYSAALPENNHNELVGWKVLGSLSSLILGVFLEDEGMNPRVKFRMAFLKKTVQECDVETVSLRSSGKSLLARMFSLIQLGDWISYYMAILNSIDPKPVEIIDKLKTALAEFNK